MSRYIRFYLDGFFFSPVKTTMMTAAMLALASLILAAAISAAGCAPKTMPGRDASADAYPQVSEMKDGGRK
jgi:hypothetical protein